MADIIFSIVSPYFRLCWWWLATCCDTDIHSSLNLLKLYTRAVDFAGEDRFLQLFRWMFFPWLEKKIRRHRLHWKEPEFVEFVFVQDNVDSAAFSGQTLISWVEGTAFLPPSFSAVLFFTYAQYWFVEIPFIHSFIHSFIYLFLPLTTNTTTVYRNL